VVPQNQSTVSLVRVDQNDGPVTVRNLDQPEINCSPTTVLPERLVYVTNCGAGVTVRDNHLMFPTSSGPGNVTLALIGVQNCPGITNYVTVMNPAMLVLGGGVIDTVPSLFEALVDGVPRLTTVLARTVRIERTRLGDWSGVIGAAALAASTP